MKKALIVLSLLASLSLFGLKKMKKLPIIYSPHYNINIMGLQKFHPFDTEKYGKVYYYLKKQFSLNENQFYHPKVVSTKDLLLVHSKKYLDSLNESKTIAQIAEVALLAYLPNNILQKQLLLPMQWAVGGTILGTELALKEGWAINLSGGYHHAKANHGEGFCFYADIPIALKKLWKKRPNFKVLVIDLDAHQGNGLESILGLDKRVSIFDMYNENIYPGDQTVKKYIDYHHPLALYTDDEIYLKLLKKVLTEAIQDFKPNLIM